MSEKPNILFLITDQQSADMLSCAGNSDVSTPNLDKLAARGTRFSGAYCSNPMCVPSRFSMMTGRYGSDAGIHASADSKKIQLSEDVPQQGLGHLMQQGGYEAVFAGKQHFPGGMKAENIGFEYLESDERGVLAQTTAAWLRERGRKGGDKPFFYTASFINPHDICYHGLREYAQNDFEKILVEKGQKEQRVLDQALELPEGVSEAKFFERVCPRLPENFEPQEDEPGAVDQELARRPFRRGCRDHWGEREWRLHRWAYKNLVELVDREIGQVLDALEESGLSENTLVVFTSDHGEMNAAHRLEHKDVLYEENLKVPLIVVDPQSVHAPGSTVGAETLVCTGLDLVPTFCNIAGVEPPERLPGVSFLPLLRSRQKTVRDFVPIQSQIGHAVVTERFKLCRYFQGDPREQFFDLREEPGEMRSVSDPAAFPEERANLAEYYEQAGLA